MENSVDSSGPLGVRNSAEQEETSSLMETAPSPQKWTDEQHCLFLKSMESTFVNQLYKSIDMSCWHSHKSNQSETKSFKQKQTSTRAPSGQFKVLRDGYWSRVDFRKDELENEQKEEVKLNPWIQRYSNAKVQASRKSRASCAKARLESTEIQESSDKNAEMTDQNFNDEALEEEKLDMEREEELQIVPSNDH
ncbi:hypothetical protein ACS0TY_013147 [Phlomoides rotata]